ncbi:MAG: ethanolamine ammonia-lyase [Deltaproteobacteria bacterium]|nr:ethanolamine ammonia-lyase [Deltaproteobacteria bacterium]
MLRREFLKLCTAAAVIPSVVSLETVFAEPAAPVVPNTITDVKPGEDVFAYLIRVKGKFDQKLYQQVIGAANDFKEGDQTIGVGAADEKTRQNARILLSNTKIKDLYEHPLFVDDLQKLVWKTTDQAQYERIKGWTMGQLKNFLLTKSEAEIKGIMGGLTSDTIGCAPKLMSNEELITLNQKIFNPLPGTKMGAKGYLSARIQPNSPTDDPDDIFWQTLDAFAYATGDIVIGTNPVDSQVESVAKVETALKDVVETFKLQDIVPWCVLSHIDVQAEVEKKYPGTVETMFQSLAGTDDCNKTFDVTVQKILNYAKGKKGKRYGLYFETGQGSEFTNGAANGVDMMVLESRKYGFSRAVQMELAKVQPKGPWLHINDVAGFIGPEVFRTREQLVRCCLEDIAMGKLHGLNIGLDICTTLHMSVSLDDLAWCQDQIMPAYPSYLIALPTRNDPMLSYLSTSFQDHVRLRQKFNLKVNDAMWAFYKRLGIVDSNNRYTAHYGDPLWVYYQYRLAKGDKRSKESIYAEGTKKIKEVEGRGVDIAVGHGKNIWDLNPKLEKSITALYDDAKVSLKSELSPAFIMTVPNVVQVNTLSKNREDYILHPASGEKLSRNSIATIEKLRGSWSGKEPNGYIVISDGLNAKAIMDEGHLMPYVEEIRKLLTENGAVISDKNIVVINGRVRAGYEIGNILFEKTANPNRLYGIVHIIGERPGTIHHSYSAYLSIAKGSVWAAKKMDHDMTKLVCNIADTALAPKEAANETLTIIREIRAKLVATNRPQGK